jgi:hypothetical protein
MMTRPDAEWILIALQQAGLSGTTLILDRHPLRAQPEIKLSHALPRMRR